MGLDHKLADFQEVCDGSVASRGEGRYGDRVRTGGKTLRSLYGQKGAEAGGAIRGLEVDGNPCRRLSREELDLLGSERAGEYLNNSGTRTPLVYSPPCRVDADLVWNTFRTGR